MRSPYVVSFEIQSSLTPVEFAVFLAAVMPKAVNIAIVDDEGEVLNWNEEPDNLTAEELAAMYEEGNRETSHG